MIRGEDRETLRQKILTLVGEYAELALNQGKFEQGVSYIPPSGKYIDGAELTLMTEAVLDGWLTTGRFNTQFEQRLAKFIGVRHLLTVNSGSSANLVAFSTLTSPKLGARAIQPGDEVIGVAAGFPTTVNPIIQYGAVPVFVDVEIGTYNIDAAKIEAAITPKTKAIMLAHTLGNPYDLETVSAICKKHKLWLVEDCCDALGSTYNGKHVGTFGDIGTVSFYPAHHITTGEGGAVFTNSGALRSFTPSSAWRWASPLSCCLSRRAWGWHSGQIDRLGRLPPSAKAVRTIPIRVPPGDNLPPEHRRSDVPE